jgi:hypothetical protein
LFGRKKRVAIADPPGTYAKAVDQLIAGLTRQGRQTLLEIPEEELARHHSGLAMRVRNDYGLRAGNPELLRSCADQASHLAGDPVIKFDADDAAALIVRGAWERLRASCLDSHDLVA